MQDVELQLKNGRGAFVIENNGKQLAEMVISVENGMLTVYHTEVAEELKGKGVAASLFTKMVNYAREKKMKVIPSCSYVLAQFKRHPDDFSDIWAK